MNILTIHTLQQSCLKNFMHIAKIRFNIYDFGICMPFGLFFSFYMAENAVFSRTKYSTRGIIDGSY